MQPHYDYIIAGAGCAGSSLLLRMMEQPFFRNKKILVADRSEKNTDDRTWCFWEKQHDLMDALVHHRWNTLDFYSQPYSSRLSIAPYQYKMLRSIDLYSKVDAVIRQNDNIDRITDAVFATENSKEYATAYLSSGKTTADYIFNSILMEPPVVSKGQHFLWQHFLGWFIRADKPVFDPSSATMMDFRVPQRGGTTFMYMLPVSPTEALIEYTLFSASLLPQEAYEAALRSYIGDTLGITEYTILHTESGKIPMTDVPFPASEHRVINIGTPAGDIKPSTGYAFRFIQKRTEAIVRSLVATGSPAVKTTGWRYHMYDSIFLHVLQNGLLPADRVFADLFRKNPAERILKFLDNESGIWEELCIMNSVPTRTFLPATWQVVKNRL